MNSMIVTNNNMHQISFRSTTLGSITYSLILRMEYLKDTDQFQIHQTLINLLGLNKCQLVIAYISVKYSLKTLQYTYSYLGRRNKNRSNEGRV